MPYTDDGRFIPSPWKPLNAPLFDVIPPDDLDEDDVEASLDDWQWYEDLKLAVAQVLMFLVTEVDKNYRRHAGVKFSGSTVRILKGMTRRISRDFLDGDPNPNTVNGLLNRTAKQWGLVVYSTEPGKRHNWPMAGRPDLTLTEALDIADQAMRYGHPVPGTEDLDLSQQAIGAVRMPVVEDEDERVAEADKELAQAGWKRSGPFQQGGAKVFADLTQL